MGCFYKPYTCKKEDCTQYTIDDKHLDLVIGAFCINKQGCRINKPENAQYCKNNSEDPLDVHSCSFTPKMQKGCHRGGNSEQGTKSEEIRRETSSLHRDTLFFSLLFNAKSARSAREIANRRQTEMQSLYKFLLTGSAIA
jgi:hypothetical protein